MNRKTIALLGVLFTLIYLWESLIVKDQTLNSKGLLSMCIGATSCSKTNNDFIAVTMAVHYIYTFIPFKVNPVDFEIFIYTLITGLAVTILMVLAYNFTARNNVIVASGGLFAISQAVLFVLRTGEPIFLGLMYFLIVIVYVYKIMYKEKTLDQEMRNTTLDTEDTYLDLYDAKKKQLDTTKLYALLGIACSGFVLVNFQFALFALILPLLAITLDDVNEKLELYGVSYASYLGSIMVLFLFILPLIENYPLLSLNLFNEYISAHFPIIPITINIQIIFDTLTDLVKLVFAVNYFSLGITFFRINFPLVMLSIVFLLFPFIKLLYLQQGARMRKLFILLFVSEIVFLVYNLLYALHYPGDWAPLIGVLGFHNAVIIDNSDGSLYETLKHAIQRRPIIYIFIGFIGAFLLNTFPDAYFAVLILNALILFFGIIYLVAPEFLVRNQYTAAYSQLVCFLFGIFIYLWIILVY